MLAALGSVKLLSQIQPESVSCFQDAVVALLAASPRIVLHQVQRSPSPDAQSSPNREAHTQQGQPKVRPGRTLSSAVLISSLTCKPRTLHAARCCGLGPDATRVACRTPNKENRRPSSEHGVLKAVEQQHSWEQAQSFCACSRFKAMGNAVLAAETRPS